MQKKIIKAVKISFPWHSSQNESQKKTKKKQQQKTKTKNKTKQKKKEERNKIKKKENRKKTPKEQNQPKTNEKNKATSNGLWEEIDDKSIGNCMLLLFFLFWEFFTPALADGFSLGFE